MVSFKKDFGRIEPSVYRIDDKVILFNRATNKKIFTTEDQIGSILPSELSILQDGVVEIELPKIRKYRIETTLKCNAGCDYCLVYKNSIPQIGDSMTIETAKSIVDRFNSEVEGGSIMLIGGEPLVNFDVVEYFIEHAKGRIGFFTNGTLINETIAKVLAKPNVTSYVSLDGRKQENFHRKYLSGKPLFEHTLRGYNLLKDAGADISITCLVTDDNVDHLEEIVRYFHEELGADSFGLSMPHYTKENNFAVDIEKYTKAMISLFDYCKEHHVYIDQIAKLINPILYETFRLYACKITGEQITFYPDGRETLCTKLDTLPDLRGISADSLIRTMPFYDERCEPCDALSVCGGGCPWDAYFDGSKRDKRTCYFSREMVRKILTDMHGHAPIGRVVKPAELEHAYAPMLKK